MCVQHSSLAHCSSLPLPSPCSFFLLPLPSLATCGCLLEASLQALGSDRRARRKQARKAQAGHRRFAVAGACTAYQEPAAAKMTKYVGTAKASRARRLPGSTAVDKRVALAMFALTGEHPEAHEELTAGASVDVVPQPAVATQLQFTFAADGAPLGEPVVVELYAEQAAASASELRERATNAAGRMACEGQLVACVATGKCVDVGSAAGGSGRRDLEEASLRHDQPGLVSFSPVSARVSFTLAACPHLDGKQQVVGRVVSGLDTLETLSKLEADADGKPARRVLICSCGEFSSAVATERRMALAAEVQAAEKAKQFALKAETPAATHARLERESTVARGAVEDAVAEALERAKRRKLTEHAGARGGMLDSLLGTGPASDDSDEDSK
jgi:cyclophilin family peptidyl-prolyl cis-trans isomerase